MKGTIFYFICVCLAIATAGPSVLRYQTEEKLGKSVQVKHFRYGNCLRYSQQQAVVTNLTLLPDPLHFPGTINLAFSVLVKENFVAPVKAYVIMEVKRGDMWFNIPCWDNVGSCTYKDVCQLLKAIPQSQCPAAFVKAGIPCHCPYNKGTYTLPETSFSVPSEKIPRGDYYVKAKLSMHGKIVGCYVVYFTIE